MSLLSRNSPVQPRRQNESPLSDSRFGTQKALCNVPGICFSNLSSLNVKRRGRQAFEFCTGAAVSLVQMDGHLSKWSSGSTVDFETNFCEDNNNNKVKTAQRKSPRKMATPKIAPRLASYPKAGEVSGYSRQRTQGYLPGPSTYQNRSRGAQSRPTPSLKSWKSCKDLDLKSTVDLSLSEIEKELKQPMTPLISELSNSETQSATCETMSICDTYTLSKRRLGPRPTGLSRSLTNLSSKPAPSTSTVPELRSSHSSLLPSNVEFCDNKQFL